MTYEPKERQILDQVVAALHSHYGERLSKAVLFGSRARRDHQAESDFDVVVVLKGDVEAGSELPTLQDLIYPIVEEHWVVIYCHPVNESAYQTGETWFLRNVRKEGVAL